MNRRPLIAALVCIATTLLLTLLASPPAVAGPADAEACALGTSVLGRFGGYRVRDYDTDSLAQGEQMTYTITLARGREYILFACGDGRAQDVDIEVFDGSGHLVDADRERDALPIAEVTVTRSGRAYARVKMYDTVGPGQAWYTFVILYR